MTLACRVEPRRVSRSSRCRSCWREIERSDNTRKDMTRHDQTIGENVGFGFGTESEMIASRGCLLLDFRFGCNGCMHSAQFLTRKCLLFERICMKRATKISKQFTWLANHRELSSKNVYDYKRRWLAVKKKTFRDFTNFLFDRNVR